MARPEASFNSDDRTRPLGDQLRHLELVSPVAAETKASDLHLLRPIGSHTWICTLNGGSPAAARWVGAPSAGHEADDIDRLERLRSFRAPQLVPVVAVAQERGTIWLVSELDLGVSLRRLLQVVGLSALQAVVIAADVLEALDALHAAELGHGLLCSDNIHVGRDGTVRLGDWAVAATRNGGRTDWPQIDFTAFKILADSLVRVARKPGAGPAARQDLLATLQEVADLPPTITAIAEAREILEAVIGGPDRARVRSELATLVSNLDASLDGAENAVVPTARPALPPAGRSPVKRRRRHRRWVQPAAIAATVLVLGGLVAVEFSVLRDRIGASVDTLLQAPGSATPQPAGSPAAAATAQATPGAVPVVTPAAVPSIAPAAAGSVTAVDVRPLGRCAPGGVCSVRALVRVWPQAEALQVRWDMVVVDRCTGATTTGPGGIVEVPAGGDRIDGVVQVALPEGSSLAVLAVTTMPARAASPPLLVPESGGGC